VQLINKGEGTMKRILFFITLTLLLSACLVLSPVQVYAQRHITVINPSFEKPDSGKIEGFNGKTTHTGTGFKVLVVPGWTVDSPDSNCFDSGIEPKATSDGKYDAYLMGGDSAIYQNLNRRAFDDDQLKLSVDARNSWQVTAFVMEIFYLNGDSAKAPRVVLARQVFAPTTSMVTYSITVPSMPPAATGNRLGILFDNVSTAQSWLEIDNVQFTNEDPTIIEVTNYSFEQPDSGKIGGWNGPGSVEYNGKIQTSQADIPGWVSDSVYDSGIELNQNPQDGLYTGYLMGGDTGVWNTTNYSIQTGDIITLRVMARVTWAATLFHSELYYVDANGKRVTLAASDDPLNTDYSWAEYSVGFAASTTPACVGKKLGVYLDNVTPVSSSWAGIDLVRINANHNVTSVSGTQLKPGVFALEQNYPNPFNPSTDISYTLKNSGKVRLSVYDILGREVAVLINDIQTAGQHEVRFSASGLSSGIYFYKLQEANEVVTKKMLLLK
jgi:hypothetical protein